MDPFTMVSEIATILAAAETLPRVQGRRASRKERREAYVAYQREAYRLMSGINHFSVLAQIKTITWREMGCAIIPMVPSFIDYVLPAALSNNPAIRNMQEMARGTASMAKAGSPLAASAVESARKSDTELRDRAIADIAVMRDITADFLAALTVVRLIGRQCPVAAAEVIRAALQDLMENIPAQKQKPINLKVLAHKSAGSNQEVEFSYRISALGKAFSQFHSIVQADHLERNSPWQIWRGGPCEMRSAKELLAEARKDVSTSKEQIDRSAKEAKPRLPARREGAPR